MRLLSLGIFSLLLNLGFSQVTCPLNTPEFPFETEDDWWGDSYSWSAGLYLSTQLGGAQTFSNISFRLDNHGWPGPYTYSNIHIYMRHTAVSNYSSSPGYPGTAGFTEVFSGSMTFTNTGVYTFAFNSAPNFVYNGSSVLEVLFENRSGNFRGQKPWFDRTDPTPATVFPGKVGAGSSWANATSISSNRQFNLQINGTMGCGAYPLPVEFLSSNVRCKEGDIDFSWSTATEKNNDYFVIEQSDDAINWKNPFRVNGNGNSTIQSDYSVLIPRNSLDTKYIRLTQFDIDGESEQLVIHSFLCKSLDSIYVYPNVVEDFIYIQKSLDKEVKRVSLVDASGKEMPIELLDSPERLQISFSKFPKGTYILEVEDENQLHFFKLIK